MTSIFSGRYDEILSRIDTKVAKGSGGQARGAEGGKEFVEVLADLEKKPKNISDPSVLAEQSQETADTLPRLSNITEAPPGYSRSRFGGDFPAFSLNTQQGIPEPTLPEPSVKEAQSAVNTMPPAPMLPGAGAPPSEPMVISAKRVTGAIAEATPSLPKQIVNAKPDQIQDIVVTAGKFHGVDPALSLAVAKAESSFQPQAVSQDGHYSKGVFQLLDSTGQEMRQLSGMEDEYDPFDPGMNSFLGVGYLRRLMDMFSEPTALSSRTSTIPAKNAEELEKLAVAAFNTGQGNVARAQARAHSLGKDPSEFASIEAHLPSSTRDYVQRVQRNKEEFLEKAQSILKG